MLSRVLVAGLAFMALLPAMSNKKKATGQSENDAVAITASAVVDRESIKALLGSDLDGNYVVLEITLTPKPGKEIAIQRDDFLLRTDKDGDKTRPFAPSQIAGKGALVVSQTGSRGGMMADNNGPIWGGYPGTTDRPRRLGGDGGAIGNAGESATQATLQADSKGKESPLLKVLQEKTLPEKKTEAAISGLLYFPMEKQKTKDLELIYTTPEGKLSLRFK